MRLMIRKPVSQPVTDDVESNLSSIRLCQNIVEAFRTAPPALGVLKFPYLPYLLGATMASLSILITEPCLQSGYARSTVLAADMLKRACYSSWMSGKTTRIIARLYAIVHSTLSDSQVVGSTTRVPSTTLRFPIQQQTAADAQVSHSSITAETSVENLDHRAENSPRNPAVIEPRQEHILPDVDDQILPLELNWPDLNMNEFDFEFSLNGGKFVDPIQDRDATMSWDGGTGTWLDRLIINSMTPELDTQLPSQNGSYYRTV